MSIICAPRTSSAMVQGTYMLCTLTLRTCTARIHECYLCTTHECGCAAGLSGRGLFFFLYYERGVAGTRQQQGLAPEMATIVNAQNARTTPAVPPAKYRLARFRFGMPPPCTRYLLAEYQVCYCRTPRFGSLTDRPTY